MGDEKKDEMTWLMDFVIRPFNQFLQKLVFLMILSLDLITLYSIPYRTFWSLNNPKKMDLRKCWENEENTDTSIFFFSHDVSFYIHIRWIFSPLVNS